MNFQQKIGDCHILISPRQRTNTVSLECLENRVKRYLPDTGECTAVLLYSIYPAKSDKEEDECLCKRVLWTF